MKIVKKLKRVLIVLVVLVAIITLLFLSIRFKGNVEKIQFNSDIQIEGALITPETSGPHPVIILLHGAGGSRQEYDKAFYKFHANAFVKKGFAVLTYTKRGSGNHNVNYRYFTLNQLINDAEAAIHFLKKRKDIDQQNIGVMGISESGWFTPELALRNPAIKFIINRVSSPFDYIETVSHEVKSDALAEGFTEQEIAAEILPVTKQLWQFYIDVYNDPSLANGERKKELNTKLLWLNNHKRFKKWFTYSELGAYDSLYYESRAKRLLYDPMPYFNKLKIPMFYVMAGKDKNIPTKKVVDFLTKEQKSGKNNISIKVYPEATHYLYKYGLEDGPFDGWLYYPDYLDSLTDWALGQLK